MSSCDTIPACDRLTERQTYGVSVCLSVCLSHADILTMTANTRASLETARVIIYDFRDKLKELGVWEPYSGFKSKFSLAYKLMSIRSYLRSCQKGAQPAPVHPLALGLRLRLTLSVKEY